VRRPPATPGVATFSWDDGPKEDPRLSAFLAERGVRATFYASTGPSGKHLCSNGDLQEIGEVHEFGIHGRTHRDFPTLTDEEIADEISWAVDHLAGYGPTAAIVAPPRGKTDARVARAITERGFVLRHATVVHDGALVDQEIRPTFQLYPHTRVAATKNVLRRRTMTLDLVALFLANGSFRGRAQAIIRRAARTRSPLHVWGHANEVDKHDLWAALDWIIGTVRGAGFEFHTNSEAYDLRTLT
jgi:peptidoglycan/xylan/chitin deacetylase (PgdA/CDA1 family)